MTRSERREKDGQEGVDGREEPNAQVKMLKDKVAVLNGAPADQVVRVEAKKKKEEAEVAA